MDRNGWLLAPLRALKKACCKAPDDDLDASLGGFVTTLGRVSRIEVREGTM